MESREASRAGVTCLFTSQNTTKMERLGPTLTQLDPSSVNTKYTYVLFLTKSILN